METDLYFTTTAFNTASTGYWCETIEWLGLAIEDADLSIPKMSLLFLITGC